MGGNTRGSMGGGGVVEEVCVKEAEARVHTVGVREPKKNGKLLHCRCRWSRGGRGAARTCVSSPTQGEPRLLKKLAERIQHICTTHTQQKKTDGSVKTRHIQDGGCGGGGGGVHAIVGAWGGGMG
jgi:hypothetical protein